MGNGWRRRPCSGGSENNPQIERKSCPWNNQNGGGGPWGGGGQGGGGPWGQGPRRTRRWRRRPSGLAPRPGRHHPAWTGSPEAGDAGGGKTSPAFIGLIALAVAAFWLFQSIYTVQPDELAIELRFGQPKDEVSQPGLHFHWWPVETVEKANVAEKAGQYRRASRRQFFGADAFRRPEHRRHQVFRRPPPTRPSIRKPICSASRRPDEMVRQIAESAMREVVGRRPAQDVFRDDREGIAEEVREIVATTLEEYGTGLGVNAISIEDAAPPVEVADAFEEVQRAEQDEEPFRRRGPTSIPTSSSVQPAVKRRKIREEAAGYKARVVQEANGEAQRFHPGL